MVVWSKQTSTWVVALMVLMGLVEVAESIDLGLCHNTCSVVPTDLWPYCCEAHNTCCEEFANSCITDCLPRVNSGDISVVEERPGLCCALYNLCCFRETPRISSIRDNADVPPQSVPITHRFSTLPGGPTRSRGGSVTVSQQPKITFSETVKPEQPQVKTDNRRPSSLGLSKPLKNTVSPIRSPEHPENKADGTTANINRQESFNEEIHRFNIKDAKGVRPDTSITAEIQGEQESLPPQLSNRPEQLKKLNRPSIFAQTQESRVTETVETKEPAREQTSLNTPKQLAQQEPRKVVGLRPLTRPVIPSKINRPSSETSETPVNSNQEEKGNLNAEIPSNQPQPPVSQSKSEPSEKVASQSEFVRLERTNPVPRSGPVVRPEATGNPILNTDISEKPETRISQARNEPRGRRPSINNVRTPSREQEQINEEIVSPATERSRATTQTRGPKLLINRQNLRSQESEKISVEESVTLSPSTTELPKDTTEKEEISTPELSEKAATVDPTGLKIKTVETKGRELVSPIRKVKLFRTTVSNKDSQSVVQKDSPQESETPRSQQTNSRALAGPQRSSPQESRGRSRGEIEVTTFRPQVTAAITRGNKPVTSEKSRDRTKVSRTRPVESSPITQEKTRASTQATRGRARGQTQVTRARPIENVPIKETSNPEPIVQEISTNSPSSLEIVENLTKDIGETSTITPVPESDILSPSQDKRKQVSNLQPSPTELSDNLEGSDKISPVSPPEQNDSPAALVQAKRLVLQRPRVAGAGAQTQQPQGSIQSQDQLKVLEEKNEHLSGGEGTEQPQENEPNQQAGQRFQSQAGSKQRLDDQPSSSQDTNLPADPETTNRQRSRGPAESRQRSHQQPSQRQASTRTRGRLTARQQLAATSTDA